MPRGGRSIRARPVTTALPAPLPRRGARTSGRTGDKEPAMAQENTSTGTPAPHPVPHALPAGHAAPPVPLAETTPSTWGRIDEVGTVYVFFAVGYRAVGVWLAGCPDEGLVHY